MQKPHGVLRLVASLFFRLVGGLLLLAASLKLAHLIDTPVLSIGLANDHFLGALHALLEILIGAFLISGMAPRWNPIVTMATFLLFAGISGHQSFHGFESCGCFGDVAVDPFWVFLLDLGIVAITIALTWGLEVSVSKPDRGRPWMRTACFLVLVLLGALGVAASMRFWEPMRMGLLDPVVSEAEQPISKFYAIDPDDLLDRTFQLAEHLSNGATLQSGHWVVVLHRPNCPHCESILDAVAEQGMSFFQAPTNARLCLVDLSGAGEMTTRHPSLKKIEPPLVESTLSRDYRWVVETPLVIYVSNNVVVACTDYDNLAAVQ